MTRQPTATRINPKPNLTPQEGFLPRFARYVQKAANGPARMRMNAEFTDCQVVEANDQPKIELSVFRSANRLNVVAACSKTEKKNIAPKKSARMPMMRRRSAGVHLATVNMATKKTAAMTRR